MGPILGPFSLDRMVRAVEKVRERLLRATSALEKAGVPYAVAGGNAVAVWVTRVDESAVRNTRDVDILIRRSDLESVKSALEGAGFVYKYTAGLDLFLDGPTAKRGDAVHIIFAGETVRPGETLPNPDVTESAQAEHFRVLDLEALVRIKLTAFRDKDRTHLRDLIDVGLIDASWCMRYPTELANRLQELIDTPEG
jgi:Nucleotidyl transferase AbiEii toxin, Type IV TA system